MANLSSIVTPTNVLTANNTQTVTNKTIDGASNTLTNINAATATTATNATVANTVAVTGTVTAGQYLNVPFINNTTDGNYQLEVSDDIRVYPSLNIIYLDGNTTVTGSLTVAGILNPNVIDFTDGTDASEHLRFGSSDDVKMFYDGANNTMELELETSAGSFIITDNGTTRFTFEKATGDLAATTFTGNLVGNADTVTDGLYTTSTIDGGTY